MFLQCYLILTNFKVKSHLWLVAVIVDRTGYLPHCRKFSQCNSGIVNLRDMTCVFSEGEGEGENRSQDFYTRHCSEQVTRVTLFHPNGCCLSVLVCSGDYSKIHRLNDPNNRNEFSDSSGGWTSPTQELADLVSGKDSLPGL